MTMPGVQYPHCRPWFSMNACCIGCSVPSAAARPSMVVMLGCRRPGRPGSCSSSRPRRRCGACRHRTTTCRTRCSCRSARPARGCTARASVRGSTSSRVRRAVDGDADLHVMPPLRNDVASLGIMPCREPAGSNRLGRGGVGGAFRDRGRAARWRSQARPASLALSRRPWGLPPDPVAVPLAGARRPAGSLALSRASAGRGTGRGRSGGSSPAGSRASRCGPPRTRGSRSSSSRVPLSPLATHTAMPLFRRSTAAYSSSRSSCSCSSTVSPTRTGNSRCMLGTPSK